jgi:hypothetical protein
MILTTHILSGAALGANVENPYAAAGLAIVLHFLLDLFPHGDYLNKKSQLREFWKVAIDLAVGSGLVFAILSQNLTLNKTNIAVGIIFSLLPDGTTFFYHWMKMKFLAPIHAFHQKLHRAPDFSPQRQFRLKNNLWDILVSLVSLIILIFLTLPS